MSDNSNEPTTADEEAGLELKEARDKAGLSQKVLAAHLRMTQQNYQKYESGKQRMLKSVYDDTIAFCARTVLEKTGDLSVGFSESGQDAYTPPMSREVIREAIGDIRAALARLEKLI